MDEQKTTGTLYIVATPIGTQLPSSTRVPRCDEASTRRIVGAS